MPRPPDPSSQPAPVETDGIGTDRPRVAYPEQLTDDERAQMNRVLDVDGEAYLRWLGGEGPDPLTGPSE